MYRYNIYILILFLIGILGCNAQERTLHLEKVGNWELVYALTYIDSRHIEDFIDGDNYFYIKTFKIQSTEKVRVEEEEFYKDFYYVLVSSFDEESHRESTLYKTQNIILPKIEGFKDENDSFLISINYKIIKNSEFHSKIFDLKIKKF